MKPFSLLLTVLLTLIISCGIPGPRDVDIKKEWSKNEIKLRQLAQDILLNGNKKYNVGINDFPNEFSYPFNDGYSIRSYKNNLASDTIDVSNITIKFYLDRGLLDHYVAIIFSNDSTQTPQLDLQANYGGDSAIGKGWYLVSQ